MFETKKKLHELIEARKMPPQSAKGFLSIERLKAHDKLFNENGIDQEDIVNSLKTHNLPQEEEFKNMIQGFKT